MPRSILLVIALILGPFLLGVAPSPTGAQARPGPEDERAALEAADGILELAVEREFNAMYDRIHPDAHAVVPRVVAVKTFEAAYEAAQVGRGQTTGIAFGEWTWPVTDKTYSLAAEVSFVQPAVDPNTGEAVEFEDRMYLVEHDGEWRWFFGNSRAFVAEAMAKYAPPPPAATPGDTGALLEAVVADLDGFYRAALETTEFRYASPGVVGVGEGEAAESGCGLAQPGFWAFYCPVDATIYLDLPFLADLDQRYGDFAAAFVVGHEWAHHVQTTVGIERSEAPDDFFEVYSIQLELMADCLTGVWTLDADTRGLLDLTDIVEAMAFTNERLGDPETVDPFDPQAHGTNLQRLDWFQTGYEDGFEGCGQLL